MSYYYNLKFVQSGDRLEVYHYSLAQEREFEGKNPKGRKGKAEGEKKMKNRREVLNRARNQIIRLVNCNPEMNIFISLTYAENMQDLEASKEHLHKALRQLQRDYPDFKYLYVLEYQERGAIHYHMLCNLPIAIKTAKTNWKKPQEQKDFENYFREVYWPHGWVDVRNLNTEGNTNVGLYVSVYLVEDLYRLDLQGAKCYGYSRNLLRPMEEVMMAQVDNEQFLKDFTPNYDVNYVSSYNMAKDYGDSLKFGTVNYFDMSRKGD